MSIVGGTLGKVAAVFAVGLVVSAAGVGAALSTGVVSPQPPTVESVENEWGEISAERTGIDTTVVVNNPNGVGVPGVVGVSYDVSMNDVQMASGKTGGVSLSPGRNELTLQTHIDNEKIPAWWASHINNGEKTTLSVDPSVKAAFLSKGLPAQNRTFETDMLSSFESQSGQSVEVNGQTVLAVEETDASWGRATRNETPLQFTGTVRNPNGAPVEFSKLGYEVSMNDVTVAEGTTGEPVEIAANSTDTIRINATLDNRKLDEWWVSHLRNDETTRLNVSVFAVAETDSGTERVPLPFLSQRVVFETDILAGGQATTRTVESSDGFGFEPPRVGSVERDWSATDSGTQFSTRVVVNNPNPADSALGEVGLDANYRVALNDVTLVEDGTQTTLGPGENQLKFSGEVSDRTITKWWISHVENGERTRLTTAGGATADLGFAKLPVPLPGENRTFETDMLAGFSKTDQTVSVRGRTVARLHDMNSTWGDATMERTPMEISGDVTNERSRPLTVKKFGYRVTANDVVLADDESRVGTTIPGKATRRIETTGYLDNEKIPAWWVSHLNRGERTKLSVSYYVVVEYRGQQFTVQLDGMSYTDTIETNAFGSA
ncbi:LEA type 2 family protein [Halorussus gelatinilyticus]|uniref:LEA type 2 family protein n=1 Tax=Halorussus gelatinilyticus TaxID=2937524 RepID=A0A8U0IL14_9EURY|nr:LEA type 2 family protein [Halorussus gelatinilyticus]UPW01458.1 LEA type 2 family protein [Halorussus gelatinilyticus]